MIASFRQANDAARRDGREKKVEAGSRKQAVELLRAKGIKATTSILLHLRTRFPEIYSHNRWDINAVEKHLADLPPPPPEDADLEDKEILERRKLRAQYLKEEFRLDAEKRRFIPVEEVQRDLMRIASAERAEDMRLVGDVGAWEGLSAAEMNRRARAWLDAKCANLSDQLSKLYQ